MPKSEFDTVRWLRNVAEVQSHRAGAGPAMLRENMLKCAEEIEMLREESRNLYVALERIYGKLLMSDRDGECRITAEDGAMAESALKKSRGEE